MAIQINIEKNFKGFALKSVFESNTSATGILGASGSGKSMTLRCIAGIETPDRGKIVINGRTVFDSEKKINLKPQERRIGYLFQNYALFPTMTVKDNILCGYRGEKGQREEKARDFMKRYQLEVLENRYPSQLSGGQQQRVALARMMIGEPEAILLDEPFSALDGYLKDVLQKDMQEFLIFGDTRKLFEQPQLLEAARLTGCKNSSRIERMGEYQVFALDWGISLRTEQKVELDMTHIAIRGHWIRPSEKAGENCLVFEAAEYVETTFEHQYLVKSPGMEDGAVLWWMRPKKSFTDEHDKNLPKYLYLPPEHLMLLK